MIEKMNTAASVPPRLRIAVSTTDSGITSRGKRILRSRFSRAARHRTQPFVASLKNWNSTRPNSM